MKHYYFTITISGTGESPAEAWDDACENFCLDNGSAPDTDFTGKTDLSTEYYTTEEVDE
jgi:hypothetical protein